jgi:putative endonuclease
MFFVYAIYNKSADKVYIGQTVDVKQRIMEHNEKAHKGYTSRFAGKWELIYTETLKIRQDALIREKQLKSYRGREFVKKHIPR